MSTSGFANYQDSLGNSSDGVVFSGESVVLGADGIQAVTPQVTAVGSGTIAQQYASTFDYLQSFTCDLLGYRTNAKDLMHIELWAADQAGGSPHKFYCDHIPALEIPITGIVPTYNGRWTKLGEGRTYNVFVRYKHKDGNSSLFSNAVATGITNLGVGSAGLASNPSPTTAPVVASSSITSAGTAPSAVTAGYILNLQLTPPSPSGWIKYVAIWAVPTTGAPPTPGTPPSSYMAPTARVQMRPNGDYDTGPNEILLPLPQLPVNGTSGYTVWVAYEDHTGQAGAMTQVSSILNTMMADIYARTLVGAVTWYSGSGPPGSLAPPTSPAIYANTASGAAHGALLYVWNGSTWSAFA